MRKIFSWQGMIISDDLMNRSIPGIGTNKGAAQTAPLFLINGEIMQKQWIGRIAGAVSATRIPMMFRDDVIVFWKDGSIHSIKRLFFSESSISNYNEAAYFELNAEKGNYKAVIKPKGVTEKKTRTVTVDRRFAEQLEDALNEHGIAGWNGFDEQEEGVMDGLGFVMYIEMEGGTKVEARGYLIFYILPL